MNEQWRRPIVEDLKQPVWEKGKYDRPRPPTPQPPK